MSLDTSLQFRIDELILTTKSGNIDLANLFDEVSLYDNFFIPILSAKILITDSLGLYSKLLFDGSEVLTINISKFDGNFTYQKTMRLYSVTNKINLNLNSQRYILNFASNDMFFSFQKKVNQAYSNTYSEITKRIIVDHLKVPERDLGGFFNDSVGVKDVTIPNLSPIEAIQWCARKAINETGASDFIFYQNLVGYNFASLSTLLGLDSILDIKFQLKNTRNSTPFNDISNARALQVISHVNAIDRMKSGVDASKFVGFDVLTGIFNSEKNISYMDHYGTLTHSNKTPNISIIDNAEGKTNLEMYDARQTVSIFGAGRFLSNYIKKYDPDMVSKLDDTENYVTQRQAIFKNLLNRRVRVALPGNFQLTSGLNVDLDVPNFSVKDGGDTSDGTLSGKYVILASRHLIRHNKHETIIEVSTSSSNASGVYRSTQEQLGFFK